MIIAKHIGRTGNNLFQMAAAIGHAKKYGHQWASDFGRGMGEPYSNIHQTFPNLPKGELTGARYHEHPNEHCHLHGVHKNICHFDYHPIPDLGPNVTLTGFFQSYKYFENAEAEVKEVFKLNYVPGYEDYVSVHVRRGDYVQHSGSFPPVTEDYLSLGIRSFQDKGKVQFVFFSDDIMWCKEFVNKTDFESSSIYEFSEGKSELEDLTLMASCGHHIIANSTFSWWAAYLGQNPDRVVISPSAETWFGPTSGVKKPVVDLLPPNWIQIHTR